MSRRAMDPAMAGMLLGMQGDNAIAGAVAIAIVMHTLEPWKTPTGVALERAMATARRYRLSEDLAEFLPPEPGRFARRSRKDEYQGVIIALKRLDELRGDDRGRAIDELKALLGAR